MSCATVQGYRNTCSAYVGAGSDNQLQHFWMYSTHARPQGLHTYLQSRAVFMLRVYRHVIRPPRALMK